MTVMAVIAVGICHRLELERMRGSLWFMIYGLLFLAFVVVNIGGRVHLKWKRKEEEGKGWLSR